MGYGITTFTLLSIMHGQRTSSFPIVNCPKLMDKALDLLLEVAFKYGKQGNKFTETVIVTHKQVVEAILDNGSKPFTSLVNIQGMKDYDMLGPKRRSGDVILAIINIMHNLSVNPDNHDYLANHECLLATMLQVCTTKKK